MLTVEWYNSAFWNSSKPIPNCLCYNYYMHIVEQYYPYFKTIKYRYSGIRPVPNFWQKECVQYISVLILPYAVSESILNNSIPNHIIQHQTTATILWSFFRDHPGEPVPQENLWTLCCKRRLTEADTPTIRLGATPSELTSAHLHHHPIFLQAGWPSCHLTNSIKALKATHIIQQTIQYGLIWYEDQMHKTFWKADRIQTSYHTEWTLPVSVKYGID